MTPLLPARRTREVKPSKLGCNRVAGALAGALLLVSVEAKAEPYRLRADVFAEAPDPAGFVMLQASAQERSVILFDAEALVWTGIGLDANGDVEPRGEAVVASVRIRDPEHGLGLRFGRMFYAAGAIRPMRFDGVVASARAPTGTQGELFAGIPVEPRWVGRSYDWLVGGRVTQDIAGVASVGFSYWQQRDEGRIAHSEIGVDASATPWQYLAFATTFAFDIDRLDLASARFSAMLHDNMNRLELFGVRRTPSTLLPATSLFAALGSYDSNQLGLSGYYRVAPRLDISATATVDLIGEKPGATQIVRADLRLDDNGAGGVGGELRRVSMPDHSWTGMRAWVRLPIIAGLSAHAEAELAIPDEQTDRGVAWPWFLAGLRYVPLRYLEAAAAFEVSSTPAHDVSFGGLLRLTATWGAK